MLKLDQKIVMRIVGLIQSQSDGFTIDPKLGSGAPLNGYMVSIPNPMGGFVIKSNMSVSAIKRVVMSIMKASIAIQGYTGGWYNPTDGLFYLDASIHVDDLGWALHLKKIWDQHAIWDCKNKCCIYMD